MQFSFLRKTLGLSQPLLTRFSATRQAVGGPSGAFHRRFPSSYQVHRPCSRRSLRLANPTILCFVAVGCSSFTGFSFSGEVREPFPAVIKAMEDTKVPVTSVDAPSSWNIEDGPPKSGLGSTFNPTALVSLTAPKPLVKYFKGRHFIGGRCVPLRICFSSSERR